MATTIDPNAITTWIRSANTLALRGSGRVSPNPRVGCVIVDNNQIIASGWHAVYGSEHAEVKALNAASGKNLEHATLVVTLEPCNHHGKQPPCTHAILERGIRRVVIGMADPNPQVCGSGAEFLMEHGIEVVFVPDELRRECEWVNRTWIMAVTQNRPYVIVKIAQSLDGVMARSSRERYAITSTNTQRVVHALRNEVDAVLVGMGTVRADNPQLTVRMVDGRNPKRIILGSRADLPPHCHIARELDDVPTFFIPRQSNLQDALSSLLAKENIQSILCEAGPTVVTELLSADLVNELRIHTAPIVIGTGLRWSASEHSWHHVNTECVGADVLSTYTRVGCD